MDGIYLAIDGQQTGPFTMDQVRQAYPKGSVPKKMLVWYEGLPNWTALSALLEALPDTSVSPSAVMADQPSLTKSKFTKDELRFIAKAQNTLMFSVLAGIAVLFISKFPIIGPIAIICGSVFQIYAFYALAIELRMRFIWLYCIGLFIPVFSLIILLIVSGKASKVLRAAGVRIGFMGGNPDDIKN